MDKNTKVTSPQENNIIPDGKNQIPFKGVIFIMSNPILLKSVSVVAFIISAIFTVLLMTSGTVGILAFVLTVGMAIILELCKCGFMYEALSNVRLNVAIRFTMALISLLLVASSIFASASYVQNQANKTKNIQVKDSTQYKQLEQGKALQGDLYNVKKNEIEDLKKLKLQQQAEGEKIINSMPKNYIDRRNQQRALTQSQVAKTQELINQKSNELSQINSTLQNPIDTTNLKLNNDSGYTAMFQTIADLLNDTEGFKDHPIKSETLEMWFFISLGVVFELVAILTAYLSQIKGANTTAFKTSFDSQADNLPIGFKPRFVMDGMTSQDNIKGEYIPEKRETRIIGFKSDVAPASASTDKINRVDKCPAHYGTTNVQGVQADSTINQGDLNIYLDYMYRTAKNNISSGYMSISKNTGLTIEGCRKIKGHLERLGVIRTEGARTLILKDNWKG